MRALLLAVLVGCAGADAMTAQGPGQDAIAAVEAQTSLGVNPGETMAFEVHLAGMLAGEAQLAVGEIGTVDGKEVILVKSRAATAGAAALVKKIVDEATTVIDVATGKPISLDAHLVNGEKRLTATATFEGSKANVTYQRANDPAPKKLVLNFGNVTVYDAHTAMAQLRGWKAHKGAQRTVYIIGGRRLWRVDVTHAGEETIGSALGNRRAIVFQGKSYRAKPNMQLETSKAARTFTVWLSDDADRVPLKVVAATELGDIVMDLTDYARP
ncbi:MAG: DUF3108 domain-containing protein [Kofleriaceae bacterium]